MGLKSILIRYHLKYLCIGARSEFNLGILPYALLKKSESKAREKSQQLQETWHKFKQAQLQLIHSEKMSSLGQLVAVVAHEINNPINFIYGNIYLAKIYSQDILQLVKLYQQALPNPSDEVKALTKELEINFIQTDFSQLIDSMFVEVERIRNIVSALKKNTD